MKFKFGSIFIDGSGKLGGQVLTKNHHGHFLKNKVTPYNPQSSRQVAVRNVYKVVVTAWGNLSDNERAAWVKFSNLYPQKNKFGDTFYLSGYSMFVKCNSVLLNINASLLTSPVYPQIFPNWELIDIVAYSLNPRIFLFFKPTIPAGFLIQVFATPLLNPGINYVHGQFNLIGNVDSSQTFPTDLYDMWYFKYSTSLSPGYAIFFKIAIIDTTSGFISSYVVKKCIVEEGLPANFISSVTELTTVPESTTNVCAIKLTDNSIITGGNPSGKIYRSTNNGVSWSDCGRLGSATLIYCLIEISPGIILAGISTSTSIYISTNYGVSWSYLSTFGYSGAVHDIAQLASGRLIGSGSNRNSLFYSDNNGVSWSPLFNFPISATVYKILKLGGNSFLFSTFNDGRVYYSNDGNSHLSHVYTTPTANSTDGCILLPNNIVLMGVLTAGQIIRTAFPSFAFTNTSQLFSNSGIFDFEYVGGGVIIAGSRVLGKLLYSLDFGLTWLDFGTVGTLTVIRFIVRISSTEFIISGGPGGKVYLLTINS